jgi:hypothetical protein
MQLQEIMRNIIYRHAQLTIPRCQEKLHPCIQAHLLSSNKKICTLLEYQGVLPNQDSLGLLTILEALEAESARHIIDHLMCALTSLLHLFLYTRHFALLVYHAWLQKENNKKEHMYGFHLF